MTDQTLTFAGTSADAARVLLDATSLGGICTASESGGALVVTGPPWPLSGGEDALWSVLASLSGSAAEFSLWALAVHTDDAGWTAVLDALAVLRPRAEVSA